MADGTEFGPGNLRCPRVADLRTAVERLSRGDARLWPLLCRAAEVSPHTDDPVDLQRLLDAALKISAGPVFLAALSVQVRLRTFQALSGLPIGSTA